MNLNYEKIKNAFESVGLSVNDLISKQNLQNAFRTLVIYEFYKE